MLGGVYEKDPKTGGLVRKEYTRERGADDAAPKGGPRPDAGAGKAPEKAVKRGDK